MKIKKLPPKAISKLQSGLIITDAVQCVLELVYNSLDAEATAIAVRIDLKNYQIQVIDNGKGIPRSDLEFVGERYMTTKHHSSNYLNKAISTYGFKGQAISSILDVCGSLTIETKSDNDIGFVKIFLKNKDVTILEAKAKQHGTGTTVTVEDFMAPMPVRRKRISEVFDLEEIKTHLQNLAIIHNNVSFTLRNENKGLVLFQTYPTTSILLSIASIFGKSIANNLKPLNYKLKSCETLGFVSLKFCSENNVQLIYVNKRVITRGVIHKLVNDSVKKHIEKKSSFDESLMEQGIALRNMRNSHTVFIVILKCPHSTYELLTTLRKSTVEFKNWKDILKCIYKAIKIAFKTNDKSLDSSSNIEEKNDNQDEEDDETKGQFGTSLLVNAVRGAPVKRRRITDISEQEIKSADIKSESQKNNDSRSVGGKIVKLKRLQETLNDSLESPIPKKQLKRSIQRHFNLHSTINIKSPNQSFVQFYEWLKIKFETDMNACKLYKDFLNYKERKESAKESRLSLHKSLMLKRTLEEKVKNKNFLKDSSTKKLNKKISERSRVSPADHLKLSCEILHVGKKKLKVLPEKNENVKAPKSGTGRNVNNLRKEDNLDCQKFEGWKLVKGYYKEVYENSEKVPQLSKKQKELCAVRSSPAPSEIYFENLIKFRNSSDSFVCQSSFIQKEILQKSKFDLSTSSTWTSHYQDIPNLAGGRDITKRNSNFLLEERNFRCEKNIPNDEKPSSLRLNIEHKGFETNNSIFTKRTNLPVSSVRLRDVEIQANLSETIISPQKINAMVQTKQPGKESITGDVASRVTPEYQSFDFINNERCKESYSLEFNQIESQNQIVQGIEDHQLPSQEVPDPDFWNLSVPETDDNNVVHSNKPEIDSKTNKILGSIIDFPTENNFSDELKCHGQKTNVTPEKIGDDNTLKQTQSFAPIWDNGLTNTENPGEKSNSHSLFGYSSGELKNRAQKTDVTPEKIEYNTLKQTQSFTPIWGHDFKNFENPGEKSNSHSLFSSSAPKSNTSQLAKTIPVEELGCNNSASSQPVFCLTGRHDFVPKGLSPTFSVEVSEVTGNAQVSEVSPNEKNRIKLTIDDPEFELLSSVKWEDEFTGSSMKPPIPDGILDELQAKTEKNMIYCENEILSASLSYCAIRVHNLLHSFTFTKELLSNVEILGQLDRKFIVAKMHISTPKKMELISLFDQHAVDERVKLEEITNEYITQDGNFVSSCLNPSVDCELNKSVVRVLSGAHEKISRFGLDIKALDEKTISIQAIPKFLLDRHEKNVKNKKNSPLMDVVRSLIINIVEELMETRGAVSKIPKVVHNIFCSEACHSAVKFNRSLTMENMTDMINKLKNCKLPFQCAHGRPSVIPIIDLEDFKSMAIEKEQNDFTKLKQFVSERIRQDEFIEDSDGKK